MKEVFSLLKLRRSSDDPIAPTRSSALCLSADKRHESGGGGSDDEGPFFDLEFSVPAELKMNASSMGTHKPSSSSTSLAEEILLNGRLFTLESPSSDPSSLLFSPAASELNSKPHFPASVIKSATKLRVFLFRSSSSSSSASSVAASIKFIKEEKKLIYKDVFLRYISKIKPLYVKVSKLRFSGPPGPKKDGYYSAAQAAGEKKQSKRKTFSTGNSFPHRLKVVPGRLRKSRSASSAVAYVCSPPTVTPKRDDSLLQEEDGIQGAIAHCKRSFHSEKGFWGTESPLLRSMSDPGEDRSIGRVRGKDIRGDNSALC